MWHELREKTKYQIKIGSSDLEKRIVSAEMESTLDEPSRFTVTIAGNAAMLGKLSPDTLPQKASFEWNGKEIFKGSLASARVVGHHRLLLEYSDELRVAKRTTENEFFKQQTVREVLQKLCQWVGLQATFNGSFDDTVPAFSLGDRSLFDLMKELSYSYGFFFVSKTPSSGVTFFSLGKQVSPKSIDVSRLVVDSRLEVTGEKAVDAVEIGHFDTGSAREIGQSTLYSGLSGFNSHPGYSSKLNWKLAKARLETHSTQEGAEKAYGNQLAKELMGQEEFHMSCFEPLAFAGDKIELTGASVPSLENGAFLVRSSRVSVSSSIPKLEITGIRP